MPAKPQMDDKECYLLTTPYFKTVDNNGLRVTTHIDNIAALREMKHSMFGDKCRTTIVTKVGENIESVEDYETLDQRLHNLRLGRAT